MREQTTIRFPKEKRTKGGKQIIIILSILLTLTFIYAIVQKVKVLTISAYLVKKGIEPTDEELKQCSEYVIKRLLGQKPNI